MFGLIKKLKNPLYKNSIFLMLSSLTGAGTGFIFWVVAARLYTPRDVGLASAIISAMNLLALLSIFGFDITLVRFIPEVGDKSELINVCLSVSTLLAFLLVLIFLIGLKLWAPALILIRRNYVIMTLFILFTVMMPIITLQRSGIFIGFRKAEYSFASSTITFMRLIVLPFMVTFGAFGIFISYGITAVLAFVFGIYLTLKIGLKPFFIIKKRIIKNILNYSFGNYIARVFEGLPKFVLPVMVTNILGAKANAYFYIAWAISMLLLAIPNNISISLLAEGAHNQDKISIFAKKSIKFIFLLLIPAIILICFFGKYILLIFGKKYSENSLKVLRFLVVGVIPFAFNVVYTSINRIKKNIKPVIYVYAGISITTIVGSFITIQRLGIIGVGISWIIGNCIITGCIALTFINKRLKVLKLNSI